MYYANCEWYVDMGEHNKPLCERKNLRPAKCSECPVYIRSIEEENAKLRDAMYTNAGKHALQHMDADELRIWATQQSEYIEKLRELVRHLYEYREMYFKTGIYPTDHGLTEHRMRELGIEAEDA